MSGQRAAAEPYVTSFETEVTAIDGREVTLAETYFYAESGGQPADRGTIGGIDVEEVTVEDGAHVHVLASEPSFRVGHRVLCRVDWMFRMYCMRAHTASHLLYGAGRRVLDELGYGGFGIDESKVRIDLETTSTVTDETLVELEELLTRAVWESRPVTWEEVPAAEAAKRERIAFNEVTPLDDQPQDTIRIVTIGGKNGGKNGTSRAADTWDVAACGGTHVRNTREVGPVTVLGRSNPGDNLVRVELAVGPRAIDRQTTEKKTTLTAKTALGASIDTIPAEIDRLQAERDALESTLHERNMSLVEQQFGAADPVTRDGMQWLVQQVPDLSTDVVDEAVQQCSMNDVDVLVAIGRSEPPFVVVRAGADADASSIVESLTDRFGGGGGGSSHAAQGGGFDADAETIVDALVSHPD